VQWVCRSEDAWTMSGLKMRMIQLVQQMKSSLMLTIQTGGMKASRHEIDFLTTTLHFFIQTVSVTLLIYLILMNRNIIYQ
jgi:hypothetical protein